LLEASAAGAAAGVVVVMRLLLCKNGRWLLKGGKA
jgi:hypothetical protein